MGKTLHLQHNTHRSASHSGYMTTDIYET